MSRTLPRLLSALVLLTTSLVTTAPAASAVDPFQGPYPLVGADCAYGSGDASSSDSGTTRGAQGCASEVDGRIYVYWTAGSVHTTKLSPWTGQVLDTAWDGASSLYVLFRQGTALKIAKVSDSGQFSATTVLANSLAASTDGTLTARSGRWWAVWTENVAGQSELFQARTLLGSQTRTRITANPAQDYEPRLTNTLGTIGLSWTRYSAGLSSSDLWFARSTGGSWRSSLVTRTGTYNNLPSVVGSFGVFYLSWARDGVIQVRDNASGTWKGRSFLTRGHFNELSVSGGKVFLAWETEEPVGIFVAQRDGSTWTGSRVLADSVGLIGLTSGNGRAMLVYRSTFGIRTRVQ